MEGTPADCVKIGMEVYRDRGIDVDMVFSGFNHGMNLGTDTLYSGTVSAAIEGALCGLPSAAMSICSRRSNHRVPDHFEAAMKIAKLIACSELFSKRADEDPEMLDINFIKREHVILSVNIPDLPPEDIKGAKICPLSYRAYAGWFQERPDEEGRIGYHYSGKPHVLGEADADESDIVANGQGYATITPLHFDLTDRRRIESLRREWDEYSIKTGGI
jgi:5'-nucleotidase